MEVGVFTRMQAPSEAVRVGGKPASPKLTIMNTALHTRDILGDPPAATNGGRGLALSRGRDGGVYVSDRNPLLQGGHAAGAARGGARVSRLLDRLGKSIPKALVRFFRFNRRLLTRLLLGLVRLRRGSWSWFEATRTSKLWEVMRGLCLVFGFVGWLREMWKDSSVINARAVLRGWTWFLGVDLTVSAVRLALYGVRGELRDSLKLIPRWMAAWVLLVTVRTVRSMGLDVLSWGRRRPKPRRIIEPTSGLVLLTMDRKWTIGRELGTCRIWSEECYSHIAGRTVGKSRDGATLPMLTETAGRWLEEKAPRMDPSLRLRVQTSTATQAMLVGPDEELVWEDLGALRGRRMRVVSTNIRKGEIPEPDYSTGESAGSMGFGFARRLRRVNQRLFDEADAKVGVVGAGDVARSVAADILDPAGAGGEAEPPLRRIWGALVEIGSGAVSRVLHTLRRLFYYFTGLEVPPDPPPPPDPGTGDEKDQGADQDNGGVADGGDGVPNGGMAGVPERNAAVGVPNPRPEPQPPPPQRARGSRRANPNRRQRRRRRDLAAEVKVEREVKAGL